MVWNITGFEEVDVACNRFYFFSLPFYESSLTLIYNKWKNFKKKPITDNQYSDLGDQTCSGTDIEHMFGDIHSQQAYILEDRVIKPVYFSNIIILLIYIYRYI